MKKILCATSASLLLVGYGLNPSTTSVSAEMPSTLKQLPANSAPDSPTAQPRLELLDPGAEPRQELRFKPPANAQQTATMTFQMNMAGSVGGNPIPAIKMPAIKVAIALTVNQVDNNGDIHYEFSYTSVDVVEDASVPPAALATMRSYVKKLVGLKGSAIVDNRGYTKMGNFSVPEESDETFKQLLAQMSSSIEQLSSPVPQEAVGIGAKWRVYFSPKVSGMNVTQIATYQLASLADNVATLDVNIQQNADPQSLNFPNMPPGATATLKSFNSQGQGQLKMRLDRLMPIRSTVSMRSNMEMNVNSANQGQDMTMMWNYLMEMSLEAQ